MKKKQSLYVSMKGTSTIISEETRPLNDGRHVKIQRWQEAGQLYVTYFFQVEGLEDKSKEELFQYLVRQGIELELPFTKGKVTLQKFVDENKQLCWGLTVVAIRVDKQ
ncbi:hypothetical protein AWH56_023925 [Anaerobacillus isosaccharinicus]|uniref:Uncharacterized protein n=1 Tax=Anaerobacillus isosaccharinicus TaxID=1532552 RepID=A0A1S2M4Y3_9BACI|nr:hypothetical protein [Anaerobacillus isosaccharinicus]MBA5586048.1 hypothetical protein [Anaerobacillus isosaccharinicus]QOY35676.1 hypothetical protein AWH56_023925 [Anaerobacillus isosaccharinicus]